MERQTKKVIEPQNSWTYESASNPLYFNVVPNKKLKIPENLCKYYTLNNNSIDALRNNYLYGSHPFQLNDLFDCNPDLINFKKITLDHYTALLQGNSKDIMKEVYENGKKNNHSKFKSLFHSLVFQKLGIISLTTDNLSLPMWALYTNNKGYLINYNVEELKKENYFQGPFPINYTSELKKIDFVEPYLSVLYQTNIKKSVGKKRMNGGF